MAKLPFTNRNIAMLILNLAEKTGSEQIAAIERGFPSSSLEQIAKQLGISKQAIISGLKLAKRTISARERDKKPFTMAESERLMRVVRVRRLARAVFTTDEAVAEWLRTPDRSLGMKPPLDMLTTDIGTAKVENLAKAMIHGVPI
jgi:putative toxin-antitoxin system antitoxin component (TIGR02293 family)